MKIAILGIGTAGITSLSHCLTWLREDWEVFSIYDPSTSILGIGESTTVAIPTNLYLGTRFTLFRDSSELDATFKSGVKYVGWRNHDIYSQIIPPSHGIHFNNFKLKDFAFKRFRQIWGKKFQELHRKVISLEELHDKVKVITDGDTLEFDYVIDCRGYPDQYNEYYISDSIPVNHCLVHTVDEPGDWTYTYHIAHRNGWMFGIPLTTRQGWGYLYNDTITSQEDAVADIAERFSLDSNKINLREFSFKNYYAKEFLTNRILKNGNRALFFEPIEAMSGFFYDQVMKHFFDFLLGISTRERVNTQLFLLANDLESFISYIYHGGSTYNSKFWQETKENSFIRLSQDWRFQKYIKDLKKLAPSEVSQQHVFGVFSTTNWIDFDKQFEYNYFVEKTQSLEY